MENQHRHIRGYRELSAEEINLMNEIKAAGEVLGTLIRILQDKGAILDQRWLAVGKTHCQQDIMALVRAVAQPTTF